MNNHKDFGALLSRGDSKQRSPRRCRKEISSDIRLPTRERLLQIEAESEPTEERAKRER